MGRHLLLLSAFFMLLHVGKTKRHVDRAWLPQSSHHNNQDFSMGQNHEDLDDLFKEPSESFPRVHPTRPKLNSNGNSFGKRPEESGQKYEHFDLGQVADDSLGQKHEDTYAHFGQMHQDPFAQSGQPHQDPFAQSGQIQQDPFAPVGQIQQDPFAPVGQIHQDPFAEAGQIQQDPFANVGQLHQDPFAQAGQIQQDPFSNVGQLHQDPFAQAGQIQQDPFAPVGQLQQDPFAQVGQMSQNPFTQGGQKYEDFNFGPKPNPEKSLKPSRGDQSLTYEEPKFDEQGQANLLDDFEKLHFGKKKTEKPGLIHAATTELSDPKAQQQEFPPLDAGNPEDGQQHLEDFFLDDQQQNIVFPDFPDTAGKQRPTGSSFKGGCNSRPPTPMNAVLKCTLYGGCKATCQKGYEFPSGDLTMFITCKGGEWKIGGDSWQVVPPCRPICLPGCQHNGICVAPNQCRCPKNYGGPQCQFEKKPCLNFPPLTANTIRSCTSKSCTVTCAKGFEFPDGSTITNLVCKEGHWRLSRTDWVSLPDCRAVCDPPCVNGGACLSLNVCQCPQQFTGPQCQYEMSACSGDKLHFNGIHNCSGDGERLVCELRCPSGIQSSSPLASRYTCLYETGQFEPQPIPSCVYGDDVLVIHLNSSSNTYYSASQVERGSYHLKNPNGVKKTKQVSWDIVNLFEADYNKPAPGECYVWGGTHLKNFDGGMYSFDSPCWFTLAKDIRDGTFEIVLRNSDCTSSRCVRSLQIFYQNSEYKLSAEDDGTQLSVDGKAMPIPTQMVGFTAEATPGYTHIRLHSLDISLKWNSQNFISLTLNENMWNKTGGLCGNLNKVSTDDFRTKSGDAAHSLEAFLDSWSVGDGESACRDTPRIVSSCAANAPPGHCELILNDPHLAPCREVVNAKPYYDACMWDSCKCGSACSCSTIAAFVRQCKRHLDDPSPNWRTIANCPYECPSSKVYSSCGAAVQPSCGELESEVEASEGSGCVEGCFCPQGTVLDAGICIQKELCPCQLRGKSFPSGSSIPKGCNTCTCSSGRWVCTEVRCGARCGSIGDPHYVTFDGRRYDFMGQCSYHLVKGDNYSIEADNVPCSGAISKAMRLAPGPDVPTCTKAVTVRLAGRTIRLKQGAQVFVNGDEVTEFPYQDNGFSIQSVSSLFLMVALENGVDVWWDGVTSVYVDVPATLQGQTRGLCGTFNLNQKDDFLTPEGDVEQAVVPFANKWKTEETCREVVDKVGEHPCDRDSARRERAVQLCGKLKSSTFKACHWHVDVEPFYQNCLYDLCSCSGSDKLCLCPVLADYASDCAREGVPIVWRSQIRECGLHCPGGQTYQACGDTCARSCQDIALFPGCRRRCVEGCNCPPGQTLDALGSCIPIPQCPCLHHNREHPAGAQLVMDNYKGPQFCTCVNAVWDCRPATKEEAIQHSEIEEIKARCSATRNEEFTFCEPVEPVTCKNMHNPPEHTPAKCLPGCVCKKGFVWDSLGKQCRRGSECPCHHGGVSYENGSTIQEDCNTCTCTGGQWTCTDRVCPSVCSTWGDSHFKTFDGRIFDFQGSCDFLLTGGALSDSDVFDIKIQIIPCGTSGVSCPKSVTLKVGRSGETEEVALTKGRALPPLRELSRIAVREAGLFVFAEVFDLGLVLQWDRGTRIYVKADPRWRNKVKGLCGNMNNDEQDDLTNPSGGISEVSPVLFADSWRLHPYCPDSSEIKNPCENNPHRRSWAVTKCGVLKSSVFQPCHSEVPLDPYVERCIVDTCGCDEGGDCECLCAAVAAYAHECSLRGVPIKWRSQEICPVQCDHPGSKYSSCVSPCPVKTCDNMLVHSSLTHICGQESCVEGCDEPLCPEGQLFSNSSRVECVEAASCKTACLTVGNVTYFEGDLIEGDDCYSCYCSHHKKACSGVPCTTVPPSASTVTTITTEAPSPTVANDGGPACVPGWTKWINLDHPISYKKKTDYESLPTSNIQILLGSHAHCNESHMVDIRCRDAQHLTHHKETGFDVECSLERGLRCESTTTPCPDFEISVLCQCHDPITTLTTPATTVTTPPTVPTEPACPVGEKWIECAIPCNRTCHFFGHYLYQRGLCTSPNGCLPGCQPESWNPCQGDEWLRDALTCVSRRDCTCRSDSGDIVKPGSVFHESECGKCQCINNQFECDYADCFAKRTPPPPTTLSTRQDFNVFDATPPSVLKKDYGGVTLIYLTTPSTVTPPPRCLEERYHSLMRNNSDVRLASSSDRDPSTKAAEGRLDNPEGSWTAGRENFDQFLQVDLGDLHPVYGIVVAGDPSGHYVTSFRLLYSPDGVAYRYISTPDNINEIFRGPIDGTHPVKQILATPVEARFLRFNPYTWHGAMSMRVDVLGCGGEAESTTEWTHLVTSPAPVCDEPMGIDNGLLPLQSVTVSSAKPGYGPESVRLSSESAWKPLTSSQLEFIMIDLLGPRNITGIETKGMPFGNDIESFIPEMWVESYRLVYSPDGVVWNPVLDDFGKEKTFLGNFDGDSPRRNWFDRPIKAHYVKYIPLTWRHEVAVRLELLGCFEPYPATSPTPAPIIAVATTPGSCNLCPGVNSPVTCTCSATEWWDGEGCSSRSECPCVVGHIPYAVGSVFHKEGCEECTCRLNGVESCSAKTCPPCPLGLRSQFTPSCGCVCKPCELDTRICPTSGVCVPDAAWCDGVRDCPDDETNCSSHVEEPKCNATCPPGYAIIFTNEAHEVEIFEPSQYKAVKKGAAGKGVKSQKSNKGIKSTKGTKRPTAVKLSVPPTCPPYECVPLPTLPPTECPQPSCPRHFTVDKKDVAVEASACPRYFCRPPPEVATCSMSGRTFSTFDGVEYKYDVCDHILATDSQSGDWAVSAFKTCKTMAPCGVNIVITHDGRTLVLMEGPQIQVDGFDYSTEQIDLINSRTKEFNVSRVGDSWIFTSNTHKFSVMFGAHGNTRIEVDGGLKGGVSGLCGLYNGFPDDDKSRPDGSLSYSTSEFGRSWMSPGAGVCDTVVCPVDLQEQALHLCYAVKKGPFSNCGDTVKVDQFISRCLESTCSCLQTSNKTLAECRCAALLDFVTTCRNQDMTRDLAGWRLTHDCSVSCPPDMTFHDCYPYSHEASCEESERFAPATACYSGCFCAEGLVRRGEACIKPSECRDCICDGLGDSQYLSFDRGNFTFSGNCSYVAARDLPESGIPNFQVVVTNTPCRDGEVSQCTGQVTIFTRGHNIEMIAPDGKTATVTVDGVEVTDYPLNTTWLVVERVLGGGVHTLMPAYSLHVSFNYPSFSISLPSHIYRNKTEGLCGNCNKDPSDESRGNLSELSDAWLVKTSFDRCAAPELECKHPSYDPDRCKIIQDVEKFGKCHALIDPAAYVDLCLSHSCHNGSVCESLEGYAKACRDVGVCINWRTPQLCPLQCSQGLEYRACALGCPRTCDNYAEMDSKPETCPFKNVEGCYCPDSHVLVNETCVKTSWCEICDADGHRSNETWIVDKCTNCSCVGRTKSCSVQGCPAAETVCPEGFSKLLDSDTNGCCPQYTCIPNPTEATIVCPDPVKPDCGYGQVLKLESDQAGCPRFTCRCKLPEECDELPQMDEHELPIGMERLVNSSGCCPRAQIVCNHDACPKPPQCPLYYQLVTLPATDCCESFRCEKPRDLCLYQSEHSEGGFMKPSLVAKKVGSEWQDGACKSCVCTVKGVEAEAECSVRECLPMEAHPDHAEYDLQSMPGPDACCPHIMRIGCKANNHVYKVGESWVPKDDDRCVTAHCVMNEDGQVIKEIRTENCNTKCDLGWEYRASNETCCGQCQQTACVLGDDIHKPGDTWQGPDNCTTFSCLHVLGGYLVTSEAEKCPDLSECPVEDRYQDGCCSRCKITAPSLSNCAPTELPEFETIHLVQEYQSYHGKCMNLSPVPRFTECTGACDSHTVYNKATWSHDSVCQCCQATAFSKVKVPLTCEDGYVIEKTISVPSKCKCQACGGL